LPASGGAPAHLSTGLGTYCAEPDWSRANPNRIAFTYRDRASGQYQIGVYDFSRGAALQASEAPFDGVEPCWLADGRHLVYTARDASASRICILDTETHRSTPVSTATFGAAVQASARAP
jgi:TolB protein